MALKIKRIIYILIILIAAGAWGVYNWLYNIPKIDVSKAGTGDIIETIEADGEVDLTVKETIFSPKMGYINNFKLKEGDLVKNGDRLLNIDMSSTVDTSGIAVYEAMLQEALVMRSAAYNEYSFANSNYTKLKALYEQGAISKQELLVAEATLKAAKASINAADARISQVRAQLKQAKESMKKIENIYSSMTGKILKIYIKDRDYVMPGAPLMDIGKMDSTIIKTNILVDDMAKVKLGTKAKITGDYFTGSLEGKITYFAPTAETTVSTLGVEQKRVEAHLSFPYEKVELKPGYKVDLEIIVAEKKDIIIIPENSIFSVEGEKYVYKVEGDKVKLQKVKTGISDDKNIEIISGLKKGDIIAIHPDSSYKDGMRVKYQGE